ncbi:unnamed protein product [Sympodiomycopsis kandeliae]
MSRRNANSGKDIRSRIKHSNANLGSGVELSRTQTTSASQAGYASNLGNSYDQDAAHQNHLGAGPSFVSLTPSDSISNFEGKHGGISSQQYPQYQHQQSSIPLPGGPQGGSLFPRSPSPTAGSTASFARQMNDVGTSGTASNHGRSQDAMPNRPTRSIRRPIGMTGNAAGHGIAGPSPLSQNQQAAPQLSIHPPAGEAPRSGDRHARSARLMAQVNDLGGAAQDNRMSMNSEDESLEDAYGGLSPIEGPSRSPFAHSTAGSSALDGPSPHLGSLSKDKSPAALGSVLSALSQAGRKGQGRRIMRGMTAEEESRRRRVERRMDEARSVEFRDLRHYQTAADSEVGGVGRIGAVLRKVKAEWGVVTEDEFNSVALALSLLDESSLGSNRGEFETTKELIADALQGTVDDHYESFATAITLHNSVLASLTSVQTSVSSSRRRLRDSRDALGSKRADLVQLWHRQQSVKEALRLLNTIEQLKNVPDRLEALMSGKHFLTAVNLLVRALKVIQKPEMLSIGAISDLRSWLRNQEGHMLEILVEEIHNHLYLKSIYCDRRWKGYQPGEETLPDVKWGKGFDEEGVSTPPNTDTGSAPDTPSLSSGRKKQQNDPDALPVKLATYLEGLPSRRVGDSSYVNASQDLGEWDEAAGGRRSPAGGDAANGAGSGNVNGETFDETDRQGGLEATAAAEINENPESDSFHYMEMLLEALARLGKMGMAIDVIHQRLPLEIHSLVENTIREVESRSEPLRQSAGMIIRPESILLASSSALAKTFGDNSRGSLRSSHGARASKFGSMNAGHLSSTSRPLSTLLRLSASESSQVVTDGEIMRDLFWTLFSKLDAVLQSHRVIHEVARQISQRSGFKEGTTAANGSSVSTSNTVAEKLRGRLVGGERLLEVWGPIQMEVRALLHEHLMDDTQSPSSRRNNMVSINEVLRQGRFDRDRSKKLFNLSHHSSRSSNAPSSSSSASATASKREQTSTRRHQESLNSSLRAFVPGLVNAAETSGGISGFSSTLDGFSSSQHKEHQILASASAAGSNEGTGYTTSMITGSHRLLVKPDAFNISVLFQPALAFVDRVRVIMPSEAAGETSKGFSAFLDEFVRDVFLPQLEDKVQTLFQSAVGGADAFSEDPSSRGVSEKPIVKSAANVVVLIDSLYSMLRTTPFHRESYSRLIIQTIVQYYAKCHERYKDLVVVVADHGHSSSDQHGSTSNGSSTRMLSAQWAQNPQLADILSELLDPETILERRLELQDQEDQIELILASRNGTKESVGHEDLITSRKKLLSLGHLEHSLGWFLKHVQRLKATDESLPVSSRPSARLSIVGRLNADGEETVDGAQQTEYKLPLSSDMAARYDTLPRTFQHLSNTVLFTLRMELRARVIHHLDLAILEGNYLVEESNAEPDPHIVDLNSELANLDDILIDSVKPSDHRFLFEGLSNLMDTMLISAIKKLRAINRPGVSKMIRNILALQQNLKNIIISETTSNSASLSSSSTSNGKSDQTVPVVNFEHSRRFWELLSHSPADMLEFIKRETKSNGVNGRQRYGFDEVRCALNLMLGLENGSPQQSQQQQSQPQMSATSNVNTPSTAGSTPLAVGPSLPTLKAGTVDGKEGTVSRQKFNEYLIELHQVLDPEES